MAQSQNNGRLILVPQYPTRMRYQEWWYTELPLRFSEFFEEVLVLGKNAVVQMALEGDFAPINASIKFECGQLEEYMQLQLQANDILLLCDLSFPGIFASALFHKRPSKVFAICHGTSKNKYDYFQAVRPSKWKVESGMANLFDSVFVASSYHARKLGWKNTVVVPFPLPPMVPEVVPKKTRKIISVARPGVQKINKGLEKKVTMKWGPIERPNVASWEEYFHFIQSAEKMLISSKEETYGYQVIDAILNNCVPIAPANLSYPELLSQDYLYTSTEDCLTKLGASLPPARLLICQQAENFYKETTKIMQQRSPSK